MLADLALQPHSGAAAAAIEYLKPTFGEQEMHSLVASLSEQTAKLEANDLSGCEAMLYGSHPKLAVRLGRAIDNPAARLDIRERCLPSGAVPLAGKRIAQAERVPHDGLIVAHLASVPSARAGEQPTPRWIELSNSTSGTAAGESRPCIAI